MCYQKRPDGPPSLLSGTGTGSDLQNPEKDKLKTFLAENLAKQLVQRGFKDITDFELHQLVYTIAEKTSLDDGNLAVPPKYPPLPPPQEPPFGAGGFYGGGQQQGYSTAAMNPM